MSGGTAGLLFLCVLQLTTWLLNGSIPPFRCAIPAQAGALSGVLSSYQVRAAAQGETGEKIWGQSHPPLCWRHPLHLRLPLAVAAQCYEEHPKFDDQRVCVFENLVVLNGELLFVTSTAGTQLPKARGTPAHWPQRLWPAPPSPLLAAPRGQPLTDRLLWRCVGLGLQIIVSWEKKYDGDQWLRIRSITPEQLPAPVGEVGDAPSVPASGWLSHARTRESACHCERRPAAAEGCGAARAGHHLSQRPAGQGGQRGGAVPPAAPQQLLPPVHRDCAHGALHRVQVPATLQVPGGARGGEGRQHGLRGNVMWAAEALQPPQLAPAYAYSAGMLRTTKACAGGHQAALSVPRSTGFSVLCRPPLNQQKHDTLRLYWVNDLSYPAFHGTVTYRTPAAIADLFECLTPHPVLNIHNATVTAGQVGSAQRSVQQGLR